MSSRVQGDPPRWTDRLAEGRRARDARPAPRAPGRSTPDPEAEAASLLGAARARGLPGVTVAFGEIERALRRGRLLPGLPVPGRLAIAGGVALVVLLFMGSIALSRGWLVRRPAATPTLVSVPAGATARVERRGRFRMSIAGPATAEVGAADEAPLRAVEGRFEIETGARAVTVEGAGRAVEIPPGAAALVEASAGGELRVRSVRGDSARAAGAAPARMPPVEAPSAPAPPAPTPVEAPSVPVPVPVPVPARAAPAAPAVAPQEIEPRARGRAPATAAGASSDRSPIEEELIHVRQALARLRGAGDAAGALRALDDYDRRFPAGGMREEAALVRIEALLVQGRKAEALAGLAALPPAVLQRSRRLRVARGELLAGAGRCEEARRDFAAVLAVSASDEPGRRAERGRAVCGGP